MMPANEYNPAILRRTPQHLCINHPTYPSQTGQAGTPARGADSDGVRPSEYSFTVSTNALA